METAGLSVPGASGPSLGFEDYSVYTNLSDEELIEIAIERSLSEDHNNTPATDTRQTPCSPDPEVRQPSTPHLPSSTSTQPGNQHIHSTSAKPSTLQDHIITAYYSSPNPPTSTCADRVEDPLLAAIKTGDDKRVSTLVNVPGCNVLFSIKTGWLAIHEAAAYGQEACLRVLLTARPGMLNKKTAWKQTALMIAVNNEHASCVRLLLERGADPEIGNEDQDTPLKKACERNNIELVDILLSHGAAVNIPCIQGYTALHEAVRQNNVEICEMLVKARAKISATSNYGMTPLSSAAQSGKLETLRYLLKHGADINGTASDGATPLYEACKHGHVSTVELLLSLKADVNRSTKSGLLPIHVAVQNAHTRIVSLLIHVTSQSRITSSGISPLHIAAEHNCNNIMELLLLEARFDPNCQLSEERRKIYKDKHSTALYFSVYNRNLEATEMLLEAGADPNLDLSKPLLVAIRRGSLGVVSLLLKYGADVNASISTQPSAFPSAVLLSLEHLPMLKLLLDHGCNACSCFHCVYGSKPHPTQAHSEEQTIWNRDAPRSRLQFCEAVSQPSISRLVGPLVSLLLNYVSHVRLCSRLMEHLVSSPLWTEIKIRAVPPHPLMQLCRLRIRHLVGVGRLKLLRDLDLPSRLIKFLFYEVDCSLDLDTYNKPMD